MLKDNKYSISSVYCLAAALRPVIYAKIDRKPNSVRVIGNKETDMCQQIVDTSVEGLIIADHIFMVMLSPSTCKLICTLDLHVNYFSSKTYEE